MKSYFITLKPQFRLWSNANSTFPCFSYIASNSSPIFWAISLNILRPLPSTFFKLYLLQSFHSALSYNLYDWKMSLNNVKESVKLPLDYSSCCTFRAKPPGVADPPGSPSAPDRHLSLTSRLALEGWRPALLMTSCGGINHCVHTEYGTFAEPLKREFDFHPVYENGLYLDGYWLISCTGQKVMCKCRSWKRRILAVHFLEIWFLGVLAIKN
jgi:hypothetical protein